MSEKITVYLKPTCTTCKKVVSILEEKDTDFERFDYYTQNLTKEELTSLIKKLDISPKDILRKRATIYKELKLADRDLNLSQTVDLILEYPDLLERPIVVCDDQVIVARPAEKINKLL